jgi:predicted nucleic acid-binding protein
MCLIIDACSANIVAAQNCEASSIIIEWVRTKGRVVSGGKLQTELGKTRLNSLIIQWSRAGRFTLVDSARLELELNALSTCPVRSDDHHVIAIARIANAGVVVTGDTDLMDDLKDPAVAINRRKVIKLMANHSPRKRIVRSLLQNAGCR